MNRKSLSFRIPERTPQKKRPANDVDVLSYGKWTDIAY